jgi:hypothetical protein
MGDRLKDLDVGTKVIVNGNEGTIVHKDLGTITLIYDDADHYVKWYDSKEVEVIYDGTTNTEEDNR